MEDLVSIIIPVYNAENFINDSVKTICEQTYQNFEAIFVNDCSYDNSINILKEYSKSDPRIIVIDNKKNCGAAVSRNKGVKIASGKYICYLDVDDTWDKEKLMKQIKFMKDNNCAFSFTSYQFADENCIATGAKVIVPNTITYKQALKNTTIWTSTVMFDMSKLTKEDIFMPNVKSEDTALWWKLLRTKINVAYGMKDVLSYYRRTQGTLSSNKFEAIKRIWYLYRNVEHLNFFYSFYNFLFYAINAVRRRI